MRRALCVVRSAEGTRQRVSQRRIDLGQVLGHAAHRLLAIRLDQEHAGRSYQPHGRVAGAVQGARPLERGVVRLLRRSLVVVGQSHVDKGRASGKQLLRRAQAYSRRPQPHGHRELRGQVDMPWPGTIHGKCHLRGIESGGRANVLGVVDPGQPGRHQLNPGQPGGVLVAVASRPSTSALLLPQLGARARRHI